MDLKKLRELLRVPIEGLSTAGTHRELEFVLEKAGLKEAGGGSKRERMRDALEQTPDEHLPRVAESLLANYPVDGATRIKIQDVLWSGIGPQIPVRVQAIAWAWELEGPCGVLRGGVLDPAVFAELLVAVTGAQR